MVQYIISKQDHKVFELKVTEETDEATKNKQWSEGHRAMMPFTFLSFVYLTKDRNVIKIQLCDGNTVP